MVSFLLLEKLDFVSEWSGFCFSVLLLKKAVEDHLLILVVCVFWSVGQLEGVDFLALVELWVQVLSDVGDLILWINEMLVTKLMLSLLRVGNHSRIN